MGRFGGETMITEQTRFNHFFGTNDIFLEDTLTIIRKRYSVDIIKFDEWLQLEHGYNIEIHGSASDFITARFGEEAASFIKSLL